MSLIIRLLTCFFKHVFLCTSQIRIKTFKKMNMFIFFSWCIIKNYEFVCKFFLVFSLVCKICCLISSSSMLLSKYWWAKPSGEVMKPMFQNDLFMFFIVHFDQSIYVITTSSITSWIHSFEKNAPCLCKFRIFLNIKKTIKRYSLKKKKQWMTVY